MEEAAPVEVAKRVPLGDTRLNVQPLIENIAAPPVVGLAVQRVLVPELVTCPSTAPEAEREILFAGGQL